MTSEVCDHLRPIEVECEQCAEEGAAAFERMHASIRRQAIDDCIKVVREAGENYPVWGLSKHDVWRTVAEIASRLEALKASKP